MSPRAVLPPLLAGLLALGALLIGYGDVSQPFRGAVIFLFLLVGPGLALVGLLRLGSLAAEMVTSIALSLTLAAAIATVMVYLRVWSPRLELAVLVDVDLLGLLAQLVRSQLPRQWRSIGQVERNAAEQSEQR